MSDTITYEVKGTAAIITLNNPKTLNALTMEQYDTICKYLEQANDNPDTIITLLQSTGRVFSAGANAQAISNNDTKLETWLSKSVAKQVFLVQTVMAHKKILAAALNGPIIGLTASLVAMCDLIYVNNLKKTFLLTPFANIGIINEGGTSASLFTRLGWSKANEALLMSKRISGEDLYNVGFVNKHYDGKLTTEEFNKKVLDELVDATENLHFDSIIQNKQLLKDMYGPQISSTISQEAFRGLKKWTAGIPLERFKKLMSGELKHKM
ncbi:uncharacterized protein SPAPADRAFT_54184 [Spathaspora passalidarum NRRL Y-27907]|uniref:3,2-trans-enoyl-CoA isomerase n=1 Tax=Spathaspora passalidarum (strain NRRL Y-27907 / 11-Y1) TaxID=619300 RepID=G3AJM4_SPAPN|nr:uncharacterized protein SPAPADRAFT_54184 [Spathaspora passalidarum NRRL Y-27907]EGW33925.1 hypothetical protein SPAPADRAFT_54184 [Spathaspora passalidarum NRRL Y-27907]